MLTVERRQSRLPWQHGTEPLGFLLLEQIFAVNIPDNQIEEAIFRVGEFPVMITFAKDYIQPAFFAANDRICGHLAQKVTWKAVRIWSMIYAEP